MLRGSNAGTVFRIPATPAVQAGASKGTLLFPEDPYLAPLHATFHFKDGKLFVRDEGSPSGTYVAIRGAEPLTPGSLFAAGDHLLRFAGPLPAPATSNPLVYGAPAPAPMLYAVEELFEGGRPGRACVRAGPSISVGRTGCDLSFPNDAFLGPRHCEVAVENGAASLRDLGSQDGTYLRLPPRAERALAAGDCVRIGLQVIRVELV